MYAKVGVCEDVGRGLGSVKKCGESLGVGGVGEGGRVYHTSPHTPTHFPTPFQTFLTLSHTSPPPTSQVNLKNLEFSNFQCDYTLFNV